MIYEDRLGDALLLPRGQSGPDGGSLEVVKLSPRLGGTVSHRSGDHWDGMSMEGNYVWVSPSDLWRE